eukprot:174120-Amphidinium_carterae.1
MAWRARLLTLPAGAVRLHCWEGQFCRSSAPRRLDRVGWKAGSGLGPTLSVGGAVLMRRARLLTLGCP